ncbi:hypothetical protein Ciccas_008645 [Cichlidogyrus casuarinus]|uniref:Uncharacterized protein n=1 Tax=Cichlidogyrus casuarinus TaxID=1844966 RepID=A0ABD2PZA8_9PLAT
MFFCRMKFLRMFLERCKAVDHEEAECAKFSYASLGRCVNRKGKCSRQGGRMAQSQTSEYFMQVADSDQSPPVTQHIYHEVDPISESDEAGSHHLYSNLPDPLPVYLSPKLPQSFSFSNDHSHVPKYQYVVAARPGIRTNPWLLSPHVEKELKRPSNLHVSHNQKSTDSGMSSQDKTPVASEPPVDVKRHKRLRRRKTHTGIGAAGDEAQSLDQGEELDKRLYQLGKLMNSNLQQIKQARFEISRIPASTNHSFSYENLTYLLSLYGNLLCAVQKTVNEQMRKYAKEMDENNLQIGAIKRITPEEAEIII